MVSHALQVGPPGKIINSSVILSSVLLVGLLDPWVCVGPAAEASQNQSATC